jgi:hypothetical protein
MARTLISPMELPKYGISIGDRQRKRLEDEGKFAKRVPLTERTYAYVEEEIISYCEARIAERNGKSVAVK